MAWFIKRWKIGMLLTLGISLLSFSSITLAAPIDCTGSSSGKAGTCSTLAQCDGAPETANTRMSNAGPVSVCPTDWICCIPNEGGSKVPKDPPIIPIPGPGEDPNPGTACSVSGATGTCQFTSGSCGSSSVAVAPCTGGTVCCITSPSGGAPGQGGAGCAGGNGTCTTAAQCSSTPLSDPVACGVSLICCPNGGPGGTGTGANPAATAGVDCEAGGEYQKIAGVCFPKNTGLSEKSILDIIGALIGWLLSIFGIIALIGFIISGLQYLFSAGDEGRAETAKRNMKYCVIGVLVALSGWIIIKAMDTLLNANPLI